MFFSSIEKGAVCRSSFIHRQGGLHECLSRCQLDTQRC
jgi:hypothetical protein